MRILYIIDLILVSLWAVFLFCNFDPICLLMFPFIVVRIASTFSLQLRERKSIILILTFFLGVILSPAFCDYACEDMVIRPFARMYDYGVMSLAGESTLMEGAWHYMGNHGTLVADPGMGWKVFTIAYLLWLIIFPLVIYLVLFFKKKLRSSRWNWKKICITLGLYCLFSATLLMRYNIAPMSKYFLGWLWLLSVALIPILSRLRWNGLTLWCLRFLIIESLFMVDIIAGLTMEPVTSLVAIVVSLPLFYYFVGYKWSGCNKTNLKFCLYMLVVSGIAFWTAQYGAGEVRCIILILSFGLTGCVSLLFWDFTRKITLAITILIVCSLILPSIALGYNQFACFDAKRIYNFKDYGYSPRGLIMVRSGKHYAIRDRFGYIMTPKYDAVESMGDWTKPFVKINEDGKWGVYDIEHQEVVVEPYYEDIIPYGDNSWILMDEYSESTGWHDFFVSPDYYYRYRECGEVSDCPFVHGLSLPLRYSYKVWDAKELDLLITDMMKGLWESTDSVHLADFYWNWAKDVSSTIDRLHNEKGIFNDFHGLYKDAMEDLEKYIDPSTGGSQLEMNASSYVFATVENYLMICATHELADSMPTVDIRREYTLFNEFMTAYEDWEIKCRENQNWYSDRPREINEEAACRFKDRRMSVENMISVVKGDTIIPLSHAIPGLAVDKFYKNLLSYWNEEANELVPPIKDKFKRWIAYRREIAHKLPSKVADSYRNQTNQLERFYTSDDFRYHDAY